MITIDGSAGEGGGQILRTSLALAMLTKKPFRMNGIRAGRKKPGLMRQHLTCVEAAAAISGAEVRGAEIGSTSLYFSPRASRAGDYGFSIGTAGSTTLVLQTVLLPLAQAAGPSTLVLEGGTHNPMSPPWDFIEKTFLPLLNRMGVHVDIKLERAGFYPAGGGKIVARITPGKLRPLHLVAPFKARAVKAMTLVSDLPRDIAEREMAVLAAELPLTRKDIVTLRNGPGNYVCVELIGDECTEVVTGFGEKGVRAEDVARAVADEANEFLRAEVPVGQHLADQLMMPMALAGEGSFRTLALTRHSLTQMETMRYFMDVAVAVDGPLVSVTASGA